MFSPNNVRLRPSARLSTLLCLPHLAAVSLAISSSAPPWLKILIGLLLSVDAIYQVLRHGLLRLSHSPLQLDIPTDPRHTFWSLQRVGSENLSVSVREDSIVTASFVLLRLQLPSPRRRLVILLTRWNCDEQALRRLRVILRLRRVEMPDKATATE